MKRKYCAVLLGLTIAAVLTGCGSDTKNKEEIQTEYSTAAPDEVAVEDVVLEEMAIEAETEIPLDPITPSEYLISDAGDYVTVGSTDNLTVTQYVYEITDEMVRDVIDSDLQMSSIEEEVDRPSAAEDVIYVDLTYGVNGSNDPYTESTYFYIGMEEYGPDFDKALTGLTAGETKKFSISFDETAIMAEWMNQTVDFEVTVSSVCEVSVPEYTDAYVQEFFGYDSIAAYETATRENMELEYEEISHSDTIEALFDAAAEQSTFSDCPQEVLDACKDETLAFYLDYSGGTDASEVYELFGISDADIEEEALDLANRRLLVSKLCLDKGIEVTSEEYMDYVNEYALYYGYDSAAAFEEDYGRTSIVWTLYESKLGELLYESAKITEEPYEEEIIEGVEFIDDGVLVLEETEDISE